MNKNVVLSDERLAMIIAVRELEHHIKKVDEELQTMDILVAYNARMKLSGIKGVVEFLKEKCNYEEGRKDVY